MSTLFRIAIARGSTATAKSNGDSGQPCLVPLPIEKHSEQQPINCVNALGESYNDETHLQKFSPKPHLFNNDIRYGHTTESNALLISKLSKKADVLFCLAC
uniref:Uncharacterized protein n=1 Tax=Pyxicephalus adspersus TaxID=30357 RepID=A0AAV2ZZX2_PYXAD|nr:TPA: hypothetical protein GDO54_013450 [Pyxicephalus adspersus]